MGRALCGTCEPPSMMMVSSAFARTCLNFLPLPSQGNAVAKAQRQFSSQQMSYRDDSGARYGPWTAEMRTQLLNGDNSKSKKIFKMFMKKAMTFALCHRYNTALVPTLLLPTPRAPDLEAGDVDLGVGCIPPDTCENNG